ncbi:TetR/AcrR family transcriptional regulator [Devosia sp. FKR38]|uniref:TetR/AcrR family transcriptional regulator n=1 Tax=Devosia sp. FKR38 TaxID=2562312 RepID=UPI0010BFDB26|nr:TetR/AcrR family transcriptional regulator [Devosia sp. FKR38]
MRATKTQAERREQTRRALIAAARRLFADKGFAGTSTPEIAVAAGVTRGALYHHFADKAALFAAVVAEEHLLIAMAVNAAAAGEDEPGPIKVVLGGCYAFLDAMADPGRRRIMLVDAPAVLGPEAMAAIAGTHGLSAMVHRLDDAMEAGAIRRLPIEPLAQLLSAMVDRAAMAPEAEQADYRKAIKALVRGLKT